MKGEYRNSDCSTEGRAAGSESGRCTSELAAKLIYPVLCLMDKLCFANNDSHLTIRFCRCGRTY